MGLLPWDASAVTPDLLVSCCSHTPLETQASKLKQNMRFKKKKKGKKKILPCSGDTWGLQVGVFWSSARLLILQLYLTLPEEWLEGPRLWGWAAAGRYNWQCYHLMLSLLTWTWTRTTWTQAQCWFQVLFPAGPLGDLGYKNNWLEFGLGSYPG